MYEELHETPHLLYDAALVGWKNKKYFARKVNSCLNKIDIYSNDW